MPAGPLRVRSSCNAFPLVGLVRNQFRKNSLITLDDLASFGNLGTRERPE